MNNHWNRVFCAYSARWRHGCGFYHLHQYQWDCDDRTHTTASDVKRCSLTHAYKDVACTFCRCMRVRSNAVVCLFIFFSSLCWVSSHFWHSLEFCVFFNDGFVFVFLSSFFAHGRMPSAYHQGVSSGGIIKILGGMFRYYSTDNWCFFVNTFKSFCIIIFILYSQACYTVLILMSHLF